MKHLITFPSLILTLTATCQIGIKGGLNASYFAGGFKQYRGITNRNTTPFIGLYNHSKYFQSEILYIAMGDKESKDSTAFQSHYLMLPAMVSIPVGDLSFQAGFYYSYLLWAETKDFYHPANDYKWRVIGGRWRWFQSKDFGYILGASLNLHGTMLSARLNRGLKQVRADDYNDRHTLWGSKNCSLSIALEYPLTK